MDTATLQNIDQPISRTTSFTEGICWLPNSQSFFYHRLQEIKEDMQAIEKHQRSQTYLHLLGTEIEQDKAILSHGLEPMTEVPPTVWPYIPAISDNYAIAQFYYGTQEEICLYVSQLTSLPQGIPEWIKSSKHL